MITLVEVLFQANRYERAGYYWAAIESRKWVAEQLDSKSKGKA